MVAITILAEARGEGERGMYAVACVIRQRSLERKLTPDKVCRQKDQFSCWNGRTFNSLKRLLKVKQATYALKLAAAVIGGTKLDRKAIGFANHYYASWGRKPSWSYKWVVRDGKKTKVPRKPVARIGKHIFYALPHPRAAAVNNKQ